MSPRKGEHYIGEYSAFLFIPDKLDISCGKGRILIAYGYHVDVVAGINRKLVRDGGR